MITAVKPLFERGHWCKVCERETIHHYRGPQRDSNGKIALHFWDCSKCGATASLDSPEEVARRCFRRETRRMRQRRRARRHG